MASTLCILLPLVTLTILLDLFFVSGLQRYRQLKKEETDEQGTLKISAHELLGRSFFPSTSRQAWKKTFLQHRTFRKRFAVTVELTLIAIWTIMVGSVYLDMNPRMVPGGNEFGSAVQSHHLWTQFERCGLCALWNGSERGGYPAFADIQGSMLHPFVIVTTLLWGVVNGVKVTILLTLWSAGIAVAGGHLSGRLELGVFGVALATAMCSLVFASILHLNNKRSNRPAVLLGVICALAILSGQGYLQVGMIGILPAVLILLIERNAKLASQWKYFLFAAVIALLLAAPLLAPLVRFSANIAKEMDPEFHSVQPIGFFVLNLVIDDAQYYHSELLGKFPYPYLYALYIGWVPVLLAIFGCARIKRSQWRVFGFLIAGIVLTFLIASAILLKPLAKIIPSLAGIRHSPQIAGLAYR